MDALARIESSLADAVLSAEASGAPPRLAAAMRHAVFPKGARIRPRLTLAVAAACGDDQPRLSSAAAAAIELLHCASLVHDDLPCMDDDDLRRGQPTVHRKWDEATAVLAGDALQTLAFELVAQARCSDAARLQLVLGLAQASGVRGMVGGQALDIAAETAQVPLTLGEITTLQAGKTGALIEWAATAGPVMAQADTSALGQYAQDLGLAFQIADDILDVEGDAATE